MDIPQIGAHVLSAGALRLAGIGPTRLHDFVNGKQLIVVHRGWYVEARVWRTWHSEPKHAAKAIAVFRSQRCGDVALSHTSAAAFHELPLYRFVPQRVHVTGPRSNGTTRAAASVARHEGLLDGQVDIVHGIPVTSLARTVADLVGRLPVTAAVALADAAMRKVAWRGRDEPYDEAAADALRWEVLECAPLQPGARGSVQGRWVIAFADGGAQLPGESASRVNFHRLGFAAPRLQVRIPHDTGYYEVDFGLDDVDLWGEFDGTGKYTDPAMLKDATTAEAVMKEKHREDDIRGRTRRGMIRWGSRHLRTLEGFRVRLASFHVHAPGGPGLLPPSLGGTRL